MTESTKKSVKAATRSPSVRTKAPVIVETAAVTAPPVKPAKAAAVAKSATSKSTAPKSVVPTAPAEPIVSASAPDSHTIEVSVVAPVPSIPMLVQPTPAARETVPVTAEVLAPVSKPVVEAPVSSAPVKTASAFPLIPNLMVFKMSTPNFKGYEDIAAFGKANLDAFVQANTLFAKGIEELSKEVVSLAQSSMESSAAATKAILAAKPIKDMVELQTDFAKTSFEKLVANSTKLGELTVKLATDSTAPIGARVHAAAEKALKPAA